MAYFATLPCGQCGRIFTCNPHLVPSKNNVAFCESCVKQANPIRIQNGLDPINILPGAYEAVAEMSDTDFYQEF